MAAARRPGGRDLTSGPITRTLLLFALPTLGSNVLQSLNGSINAIWLGRLLGEAALAATANANIIMFLMFGAVFGFGMASTILIGQAMGARDIVAARRAFGTAVGLVLTGAIVIATLGWLFSPESLASPTLHLFSGATMLGAFFILTDPVTASTTNKGRLIFGALTGVLVWLIRSFGGYPDGVAFAVLLANITVPLIDYYTRPRAYGHR